MSRWSAADIARISRRHQAEPLPIENPRARKYKYGNTPTLMDGIRLDSKLEAKRYQELKLLLVTGQIQDLKVHEPIYLHVNGIRIGYYEADFLYLENGARVCEDCKGTKTPLYQWKKKHVRAEHGIDIREITR